MAGPFSEQPFSNFMVSPVGLVPKKTPGEFRMIHHLSFPEGNSVNDFIDKKYSSAQYTNFDEAVHMVQDLGRHCKLFKMDLKIASRLLPVRREDFEILGIQLNGMFSVEKALPFGASVSCKTFEQFSSFLEFCVKSKMSSGKLIHYLDDFLGGDKSELGCRKVMDSFINCMHELNVPLATEKTEGPTEIIVFLALELDSAELVVRIPKIKIVELQEKIHSIVQKQKINLKQMQSLIGSLNFVCRAIPVGRPF